MNDMYHIKDLFRKLMDGKDREKDFEKVVEEQLEQSRDTLESLRDYDAGKKEIRTDHIEKRLSRLRDTS